MIPQAGDGPSLCDSVLELLAPSGGRELTIGGIDAEKLVEEHGSPLYVYDAEIARRQLRSVTGALGPRVQTLLALKANPCAALARVLQQEGAGAEVASAGEILIACAAGFAGDRIQFAGPGKSDEDIALAMEKRVSCLNVESEAELDEILRLGRSHDRAQGIAFRVNPRKAMTGSRMRMAGTKKFGIDADEVAPLVRRALAEESVDLRGLHVYAGTQCFDASAWVGNARALVDLCHELEVETGARFSTLNFGGGFGIPCFEGDPVFDLEEAGRGIAEVIEDDGNPDRSYFVELGRYLVANSGVYLTRVTYTKRVGGKRFAILDGGLHHHSAAAGVGSVIRRPFPIVACHDLRPEDVEDVTLGGPLCTPADEFAADVRLPQLERGDLVAILVSGAYGFTFSNLLFLSHSTPAEVVVDRGRVTVARRAGNREDALRSQTGYD